jgi:hypothetical protein
MATQAGGRSRAAREALKALNRAAAAYVAADCLAEKAERKAVKAEREASQHPERFHTGIVEAHALQLKVIAEEAFKVFGAARIRSD